MLFSLLLNKIKRRMIKERPKWNTTYQNTAIGNPILPSEHHLAPNWVKSHVTLLVGSDFTSVFRKKFSRQWHPLGQVIKPVCIRGWHRNYGTNSQLPPSPAVSDRSFTVRSSLGTLSNCLTSDDPQYGIRHFHTALKSPTLPWYGLWFYAHIWQN